MKILESLKFGGVIISVAIVSFIISFVVCGYQIDPIKKEFESHDHDEVYLLTSSKEPDIDSTRDVVNYVDSKVETRIQFLRNELKYKFKDGNTMLTIEVLDEILNYLGLSLEYTPQKNIKATIELKQSFSEQSHKDGIN